MLKNNKQQNKKIYQCPECLLHYDSFEMAHLCGRWCSQHKSCNVKIIAFALENIQ